MAIRHHQPSSNNDAHMSKEKQGIMISPWQLNYEIARQIIYTVWSLQKYGVN